MGWIGVPNFETTPYRSNPWRNIVNTKQRDIHPWFQATYRYLNAFDLSNPCWWRIFTSIRCLSRVGFQFPTICFNHFHWHTYIESFWCIEGSSLDRSWFLVGGFNPCAQDWSNEVYTIIWYIIFIYYIIQSSQMGMDRQNIFKTTRQIGSWVRVKHGHPLKLDAFWDFLLSKWPVHQCICGLPNLKYHFLPKSNCPMRKHQQTITQIGRS